MTASPPDYYALLGVDATADLEAIRAAYRTLAKQHHPDMAEGEDAQSTDRFLQIQEAYDVLRDVDRRAQYDLDLLVGEAAKQAQGREARGQEAQGPAGGFSDTPNRGPAPRRPRPPMQAESI